MYFLEGSLDLRAHFLIPIFLNQSSWCRRARLGGLARLVQMASWQVGRAGLVGRASRAGWAGRISRSGRAGRSGKAGRSPRRVASHSELRTSHRDLASYARY